MAVLWWITSLFLLTTCQQTGTRAQDSCHSPSSLQVIDNQVTTTSFRVSFTHRQCGNVNFTLSLGPQLCFSGTAFNTHLHCVTLVENVAYRCASDRTSSPPLVDCFGSMFSGQVSYSCGISQLDPGQSYSLSISTVAAGAEIGPTELAHLVVTDPEVPANLTVVHSLTSTTSITVHWDVVGVAEQFIITAICYHDNCVNTTTFSWDDCLLTLTATINNLTPGAWYSLAVVALSGSKDSADSVLVMEQTDPAPPSNVTFELVNVTSLVIVMAAEGVYDGYNLSCTPCVGQRGLPIFLQRNESRYLYDGLTRGQMYNFTIVTISGPKYSQPMETVQVIGPSEVENITVLSVGSRHVSLEWRPPEGVYSHFIINVTSSRGEDMVKSNSLNASLADLTPGTMYNFTVYTVSGDKESVGIEYGPVSTLEERTDGLANTQSVIIGVCTAGGIIALIIIILTGIFCLRRRQKHAGRGGDRADEMMSTQVSSEGTTSREDIMSSQLIDTSLGNRDNMADGIVNESLEMTYAVPEDSGRLSQVQTVDDVSKFLQYHNFAEYIGAFQDHEVDGVALRCLDSTALRDLMPKAGPRAKFSDILKQQGREQKISKATSERQVTRLMFREIPRENLKLGKLLGRGQFGEVRLGEVRNRGVTTTVAVKTLHASALDSDRKDLLGELDILVTVGRHDNVISLVGACTIDNPLCVVVEYAPNGSLKDWLKANSPEQIKPDSGYCNIETPAASLPMEQLIQFGIDVASGMSHLAAMQCVHRDLAARNILLGEGLVAKVSDFGLSRDIYEDAEYVKTTLTKLPLRWMAYESLFYKVYTTQSDVWSYGVLLWEIMTMGKLPYQGIKGKEMMNMIKDGYRLEKPALCPDDIYDVMISCWQNLPGDRPTFPQLKTSLDRIVQQYKTYASLLM
ncbi:uncharacterized protein LOC144865706 [Branchiostoma floridae x Branchiostoma japonicum]